MIERQSVAMQQSISIEVRQLEAAGLHGDLEVMVGPGEIRIRTANAAGGEAADEPLLPLAGALNAAPLSSPDIDRELYGAQVPHRT